MKRFNRGNSRLIQVAVGVLAAALMAFPSTPVRATAATSPIPTHTIATGSHHTCTVDAGNQLYCWGQNDSGELGLGTLIPQGTPELVSATLQFLSVSAGDTYTCAISVEFDLYCWGRNIYGTLGDGTTDRALLPLLINSGTKYASVSAGDSHTCAITSLGALQCWGFGGLGSLGDGTNTSSRTAGAITVSPGVQWAEVAVDGNHSCAISIDRALYCWGYNAEGQVGNGGFTNQASPVRVFAGAVSTFSDVRVGGNHSCAISQANALFCWGKGNDGRLGFTGSKVKNWPTPVAIAPTIAFKSVAPGAFGTCAISLENKLYCWGLNFDGQVGDGTRVSRDTPIAIDVAADYQDVSLGGWHGCGIKTSGSVTCWGGNWWGEVGDGTYINKWTPTTIRLSRETASAIPQISKLTSAACTDGLSIISESGRTAGITSLARIPGGLAIAGEFWCGGVRYHLAVWDGTSITFPASQPPGPAYAMEAYKGQLWVGQYGRWSIGTGPLPSLGARTVLTWGAGGRAVVVKFVTDGFWLGALVDPDGKSLSSHGERTLSNGRAIVIGNPNHGWVETGLTSFSSAPPVIDIFLFGGRIAQAVNNTSKSLQCVGEFDISWANCPGGLANLASVSTGSFGRIATWRGWPCAALHQGFSSCLERPTSISGINVSNDAVAWDGDYWVSGFTGFIDSGGEYNGLHSRLFRNGDVIPVGGFIQEVLADGDLLWAAGSLDSTSYDPEIAASDPNRPDDYKLYLARWVRAEAVTAQAPEVIVVRDTAGGAQVECTTPTWNGGDAIQGYEYSYAWSGGSALTISSTGAACGTILTYDHFSPAVLSVKVRSITGSVNSNWSEIWTGQPTAAPDAVSNLQLTEGNRSISLVWALPEVQAAPAITRFEWSLQDFLPGTVNVESNTSFAKTITGLSNGTNYTVRLRACNALGCGPVTIATGTPAAVPSPPRNVSVVGRDEALYLTWQAPTSTNGAALTGYEFSVNSGAWQTVTAPASSLEIPGTNGVSYSIRLRARNRVGASSEVTTSTATPNWVPPSAPQQFTTVALDGAMRLNWAAPATSGTRSRTGYRVYWRTGTGEASTVELPADTISYLIVGLENGIEYQIEVAAYTSGGEGTRVVRTATPAALSTPPVSVVLIEAANSLAQLSWAAPVSDGGSAITGYRIRIWALGNVIRTTLVGAASNSVLLTNLPNEVDIRADVHAVTSAGESERASVYGRMRDSLVSAVAIGVSGVLYPVRDGYGDLISLGITLSERADVTLTIQSSTGTTWLTKNYSYAKGDLLTTWNGRIGSNTAGAGTYTAKWKITDLYGNTRTITQRITVSPKRIVSVTSSRSYAPQKGAGSCYEWDADSGSSAGYWRCAATAKGAYRLDVDAGYDQQWQYTMAAPISGFREITGVEIRVCGTVSTGDAGDIYLWSDNDNDYRTWDRISGDTTTCRDVQLSDPSAVASNPAIWLYVQAQGGGDPLLWTVTSITVTVTGTVLK